MARRGKIVGSHTSFRRLHCRTVVGLCSAEYHGIDLISFEMQLRFLETMQTRESMWRMEKKDEVRSGVGELRNGKLAYGKREVRGMC